MLHPMLSPFLFGYESFVALFEITKMNEISLTMRCWTALKMSRFPLMGIELFLISKNP